MRDEPLPVDLSQPDCEATLDVADIDEAVRECYRFSGRHLQLVKPERVDPTLAEGEEQLPRFAVLVDPSRLNWFGHIEHHNVRSMMRKCSFHVAILNRLRPTRDDRGHLFFVSGHGHIQMDSGEKLKALSVPASRIEDDRGPRTPRPPRTQFRQRQNG